LKELQDAGVTLPEAVVKPPPEEKKEPVLTPGQQLRKQELVAALEAIKAVGKEKRKEEKELKARTAELEKAKKELDERVAKTKTTYNKIVAEIKSLS
jgi:hypothetical protein